MITLTVQYEKYMILFSILYYSGNYINNYIPAKHCSYHTHFCSNIRNVPVLCQQQAYIVKTTILCIALYTTIRVSANHTVLPRHNSTFVELFQQKLRPKFRLLLHYTSIMKRVGPLRNIQSMRYKSKQRQSKMAADVTVSRRNITQTLTQNISLYSVTDY